MNKQEKEIQLFPDGIKEFRVNKKLQEKSFEKWVRYTVHAAGILFVLYVFLKAIVFMMQSELK